MSKKTIVVVQGASKASEVPGIDQVPAGVELRFSDDLETLKANLPGADVVLGWNFRSSGLAEAWHLADNVNWVQWSGAGVDAIMFPALVSSEAVLTNCRGIFDRAMAEYVLGLLIAMAKQFPTTMASQKNHHWDYRLTELMHGKQAVVVGVGSIGREIARVLSGFDLDVCGVGRTARSEDDDFRHIYAHTDLLTAVAPADYVVVVVPSTPQTRGMIDAQVFKAMKPTARLVNVARGNVLDETALIKALDDAEIASAALDVFLTEPLEPASPLWDHPNVIVSPHMSGDYVGHHEDMVKVFLDNLERYRRGQALNNVIDKAMGFAAPH